MENTIWALSVAAVAQILTIVLFYTLYGYYKHGGDMEWVIIIAFLSIVAQSISCGMFWCASSFYKLQ